MSPENLEKISHPELDISKDNPISVRKLGIEPTDRYTRNLKISGTSVGASQQYLKDFRKVPHPELEICLYLSNFSKEVSQLTH